MVSDTIIAQELVHMHIAIGDFFLCGVLSDFIKTRRNRTLLNFAFKEFPPNFVNGTCRIIHSVVDNKNIRNSPDGFSDTRQILSFVSHHHFLTKEVRDRDVYRLENPISFTEGAPILPAFTSVVGSITRIL
jgi:hypothetical protein